MVDNAHEERKMANIFWDEWSDKHTLTVKNQSPKNTQSCFIHLK